MIGLFKKKEQNVKIDLLNSFNWIKNLEKQKLELSNQDLDKRLSSQKGIKVEFQTINDANHFFSKNEVNLVKVLDKYIKKETALY